MHKLPHKILPAFAVTLSTALIMNMCIVGNVSVNATDDYDIKESANKILKNSVEWLAASQKENGSWGDEQTVNDTCYSLYALSANGYDASSGRQWLNSISSTKNGDILSHKLFATADSGAYAKDLLAVQNKDGGFGLDKSYTSEVYDTILAIEAFESVGSTEYNTNVENMISFLVNNQNSNGSWSCNQYNDAENALTARVAYDMVKYLSDNSLSSSAISSSVSLADIYLSSTNTAQLDMSENNIEASMYYSLLKQAKGDYTEIYDIVQNIESVQNGNGSFYNSIYDTYLVIRYLNEIDTVDESYTVDSLEIALDENSIFINTPQDITGEYTIKYNTATTKELSLVTEIYDDENVVYSEEKPITLDRERKNITGTAFKYSVNENTPKVLKTVSVLTDGEKQLNTYINFIYVQETPITPKTEVTDAGLKLNEHYGYTGEQKKVTASYYMLYSTNVNYILNVKTTVYCGEDVVTSNEKQAVLTPNSINIEDTVAELNINVDVPAEYKFVTEFYDGEKLLSTVTDYYTVYENPQPTDPTDPTEPEQNNVITQFMVNLDDYFLYTSSVKKEKTASCEMIYSFTHDTDITVKGYVLDGEEVLKSNEQTVNVKKEDTSINFELIKISDLDISSEKQYIFKAEIYDAQGNYIGERTAELNIKTRPEIALTLTADTNTGEDYSIDLAWNDISSSYEQYGYRVLRSVDGGKNWETRSTWSGAETVRVLNVYPIAQAESYLKDWMNTVVDDKTGETAGKGMFEIDTVHIGDYNSAPDTYLKDSNGNYKYDVLLFGTYDANASRDLSQLSREATQEFINSGRGALFGHDTVCLCQAVHPNFAAFGDQLGIKVTGYSRFRRSSKVQVVNEGFLTSFPWSITGTITIPQTHTAGQFSGGTLAGTVWMKLSGVETNVDSETGAVDDAYLVTNNQLGLIQTGDSSGQATPDECKVFANTLFYLKQLTGNTSARDNSFYDTTAPEKPSVDMSLTSYNKDNYGLNFDISSKDLGTTYQYRTEAIPKSNTSDSIISNTVVSEAFADLKGFVVMTTESSDSALDSITYEDDGRTVANVVTAQDGKITYSMNNLEKNKKYYLHIFAVDNANNISEEYVKEICDSQEVLSQADINSTLTCDKGMYSTGETAVFTATAYTTGSSINAQATLQLCDLDGNALSTVADNINTQLTSAVRWSDKYNWTVENVADGRYMAIITWYVAGVPAAQSKCLVKVGNSNEDSEIKLKADVTNGENYSNTLSWNDINKEEADYIPTDFSVVLDVSGSMAGNRIESAKEAIDNFIDQMGEGDRMNLITFEYNATLLTGYTDNKETLHNVVSNVSALGATSVYSGLNMAVQEFEKDDNTAENYNKIIILICDGDVDNCLLPVRNAISQNITIHTINVVSASSSSLQNISSQTGGNYYYTNVVSDMSEIMQYIKIMNDRGGYYYQVQREGEVINAVTKTVYPDKGFKDKAAPEIITTSLGSTGIEGNVYNGYINVSARDNGTDYDYLVRAIDKSNDENQIYSNTVTTKAISGIKGYYYKVDTVNEAEPSILEDENYFINASDELKIDVNDCQRGTMYYLHIYAEDNAGNISSEYMYPFIIGSPLFNTTSITTSITTDKESYNINDNAYLTVTAKAGSYKTWATGVVEILDSDGSVVDTIETGYAAEITSYEDLEREFVWNVKNVVAGNYTASIKWYIGGNIVATDTAEFTVNPDGDITDNVSTDKTQYNTNENILVSDDIFNNTTNQYTDLDVSIDITDNSNKVVSTLNGTVSSFSGGISNYSDYLKASDIGIGEYRAVSSVKYNGKTVASSSTIFNVVDYTILNDKYSGKISVENNSDKDKLFNYNVTNTGNADGYGLTIKVSVYNENGEVIDTITKQKDILKGETVNFSEMFNTEALSISTYPVILSVVDSNGDEALLDESGFEINFINKYTVKFVDDDGTVLDTQLIEYGNSAVAPKNPEKQADAQYTYKFDGWDTDFSHITADTTVKAKYNSVINKYTVKFVNDDETVLDTQTVEYGNSAIAPKNPEKQADKQYTYKFVGWDTDFSNVRSDITVKAVYLPVEIPTEPATTVSTEPVTQIATQVVTQANTQKPTQVNTQAATSVITEPATQASTNSSDSVVNTGAGSVVIIIMAVMSGGFITVLIYGRRRKDNTKEGR